MMLLKLGLFFTLLLLLPDWYIDRNLLKHIGYKGLRFFYWVPSGLLLAGMLFVFTLYRPGPEAMQQLSNFLLIFLCFSVPKALFVLIHLLLRGMARITGKKLYGEQLAGALAIASLVYIIYGATAGKENFTVREVTFQSADLPQGFDGYRILQLSDLHTGSWKGNGKALQRAVDLCNKQQADVIVFTGDLVNNLASELKEFVPILSELKAKDGVFSVLGNHDYSPYIRWESPEMQQQNLKQLIEYEREMGWKLLMNEHRMLHSGKDSIVLAGVENSGNPPFPNKGDLKKALAGTDGLFKVLLSHDPTHWKREVLPHSDVQLMLAGHTHNMQFSLLGWSPSGLVYPEHEGLYTVHNRGLYVNIGLGYLMFPMRLGAWPEITVITLKRK
ncbi:MAG: metallophosphoesterase [Phocaeicola sp.]|nr:metallophosphoesterase [Phocaeicola sp.]